MFSEKEQALLDFINSKEKVSVEEIKTALGDKIIGGIGKLIQAGKVQKKKIREGQGYSSKNVVYYFKVEEKDDSQVDQT